MKDASMIAFKTMCIGLGGAYSVMVFHTSTDIAIGITIGFCFGMINQKYCHLWEK